jgi:hypothetical protein
VSGGIGRSGCLESAGRGAYRDVRCRCLFSEHFPSTKGMDPQSVAFQPREDFWRFQNEMLRVQENQADLSDRVSRLERKQEDDSRLKNVWGTSSPFPSVLGGTPQQGTSLILHAQSPN